MPCCSASCGTLARNHTIRSSLVAAKIVPAVSDVWVRQALHCHSARFSSSQGAEPPDAGHAKPSDERQEKAPRGISPRFVEPLELHVRQASLKLHPVASHRASPRRHSGCRQFARRDRGGGSWVIRYDYTHRQNGFDHSKSIVRSLPKSAIGRPSIEPNAPLERFAASSQHWADSG